MKFSNSSRALLAGTVLAGAVLVCAVSPYSGTRAFAQSASQTSGSKATDEGKDVAKDEGKDVTKDGAIDPYDRTAQVWYYQRIAKTGWERGQEIYYMKCWICHNDYTRKATPAGAAPTLRGLYKRSNLSSGEEVNDENVTTQIRMGSAHMPGYGPVLTDKDLADLVTYLREKCCWDEMNPVPNPRYHPQ